MGKKLFLGLDTLLATDVHKKTICVQYTAHGICFEEE